VPVPESEFDRFRGREQTISIICSWCNVGASTSRYIVFTGGRLKKHTTTAVPHSPSAAGPSTSPPRRGTLDRRAGAASRADEERYQLVCQAVAEGIYEWNVETNALSVSARLIEIFGLGEADRRRLEPTAAPAGFSTLPGGPARLL
jgi:PAS domain-containing protein